MRSQSSVMTMAPVHTVLPLLEIFKPEFSTCNVYSILDHLDSSGLNASLCLSCNVKHVLPIYFYKIMSFLGNQHTNVL